MPLPCKLRWPASVYQQQSAATLRHLTHLTTYSNSDKESATTIGNKESVYLAETFIANLEHSFCHIGNKESVCLTKTFIANLEHSFCHIDNKESVCLAEPLLNNIIEFTLLL